MPRLMKNLVIAITALMIGGNASVALAQTEDSPGWQCARMGDRFCGGKTAPVRFAGKLVLVRGLVIPRHSLQLWLGRDFQVGRFAVDCKPVHPYVVGVSVGDTTYAVIHACKHTYKEALS
jgi:hypothetical protein